MIEKSDGIYFIVCVCSECGRHMGIRETSRQENHGNISHGVCADCMEILYVDDFTPEELQELVKSAREKENAKAK